MEENGGDDEALPLVKVLAVVLENLIASNKDEQSKIITKFSAAKKPAISIYDYLMRIHLYGRCSPSCFVLALVYIDRLIQRDGFTLVGLNIHRVIITSLMIAAKFFDDFYFNNAFYARVGGIGTVEINELEVDFLRRLEYSLHVTTEEFERYSEELRIHSEDSDDALGGSLPLEPSKQTHFRNSGVSTSDGHSSEASESKHGSSSECKEEMRNKSSTQELDRKQSKQASSSSKAVEVSGGSSGIAAAVVDTSNSAASKRLSWPSKGSWNSWYAPIASVLPSRTQVNSKT